MCFAAKYVSLFLCNLSSITPYPQSLQIITYQRQNHSFFAYLDNSSLSLQIILLNLHVSTLCWFIIDVTEWIFNRAKSPMWLRGWQTYIHKRRYWRFDFDVLELRNFKLSVKSKATGTPQGVYYIYALGVAMRSLRVAQQVVLYIYIGVGLSALYIARWYFLFVTYLIISRYTKTQT